MGLQTLSSRVNDPQNTFVLTVGMMNGGTQSNIIADEVELVGTTRAFDVDEDTFPDGSAIYARFAIDCLKKLGKHRLNRYSISLLYLHAMQGILRRE